MASGSDHFFPRNRHGVKESLQRRFAKAPAPLMWPTFIVACDPLIEIILEFRDRGVEFFTERDKKELVQHCLIEALTDPIIRHDACRAFECLAVLAKNGVMSPSGTRGIGSTKVRAGRRKTLG